MSRSVFLIAATIVGCSGAAPPRESNAQEQAAPAIEMPTPTPRETSTELDVSRDNAISRAAERVAPAVVSVNVTRRQQRGGSRFDTFYGRRDQLVQGFGSGFIITADGLVITNQHVTAEAVDIVVTTRDGTDYPAELLGADPLTDIAILKIDGSGLPTAELGVSSDLRIGEWVVAFGNPYAYLLGDAEPTVTAGVVSAVERNLLPSGDDPGIYVGMIQTDAAINPGNSGGPLTNALGQVVGVNSSIFSNSGGSVGIGFAIPVERAIRVANELQAYGTVRHVWTGMSVATSDQMRDWKQSGGLRVTSVSPDSPADRGGLRENDVLLSANNTQMRTFLDWEAARLDIGVGDAMEIEYLRSGQSYSTSITVGDLPSAQAERISVLNDIEVATLTPAMRTQFDLVSEHGAVILGIGKATSRATGLLNGDVIIGINRNPVTSAEDVPRLLNAIARGRGGYVQVYFERDHRGHTTDFRIRQ